MKLIEVVKKLSQLSGFVVGASKIVMAILSHSWLLFIHAIYNIIKAGAKCCAIKECGCCHSAMLHSGMLVTAASAVYLVYSLYIFSFGSTAYYHMYIALGIAAVTTYELGVTIYGLRKARKENDVKRETVRCVNFASALISVSLTQTAILSFANAGKDMSHAYAIGDAIFGFLALLLGLWMIIRAKRLKKTAPMKYGH